MSRQYTLQEIEEAIDTGRLYVHLNRGGSVLCRRNGKTVTKKKDPDEYRIPFKYGFGNTGQITRHVAFDTYYLIHEDKK